MATYRITTTGDGAGVTTIDGTFEDAVKAVAEDCFHNPEEPDIAEVRGMMTEGFDGNDGWDGTSVHLQFEDGSVLVELVEGR